MKQKYNDWSSIFGISFTALQSHRGPRGLIGKSACGLPEMSQVWVPQSPGLRTLNPFPGLQSLIKTIVVTKQEKKNSYRDIYIFFLQSHSLIIDLRAMK